MSKAQKYHDLTTMELNQKYADLKNELFNLRFQQTTGQLKNPLALRTLRKDIARVMTILKQREMAGNVLTAGAPVAPVTPAVKKGAKK